MKAFVTGGTGFIGGRLVSRLTDMGYEVHALVRSQKGAKAMKALGAKVYWGDVRAHESLPAGMKGCDIVFHVAGWYRLGSRSGRKTEITNIEGTRNVLQNALELGIPKIIYTSSLAVFGDTHGILADESFSRLPEPFLTEYDRTKWIAQYQVALPLIEQGAPIVILMPGAVYGPGDKSLFGDMMRGFYRGFFPVLPGPDLTLSITHVDDVVDAHILAAEKGTIGESYIIAGTPITLREVMHFLADISGKRPPVISIPSQWLKPLAPFVDRAGKFVRLPALISRDAIAILGATYIGDSRKAVNQLGWQTRPIEDGLTETYRWIIETTQPIQLVHRIGNRRLLASTALGAALGLLFTLLLNRRKK